MNDLLLQLVRSNCLKLRDSLLSTTILLSGLLLVLAFSSCGSSKLPPKRIRLPEVINEASGLVIERVSNTFYLNNDSGDGPNLYAFKPSSREVETIQLAAEAVDWESLAHDRKGGFFIADTGNNQGLRKRLSIYRYTPSNKQIATIEFVYPSQDGRGRSYRGNYDCEALVYNPADGKLHLFTKAMAGKRKSYWTHHFVLPAQAGTYEATLVDSLYLPRRVVTGAALDNEKNELVLITYNYQKILGLIPFVSSSLITLKEYPSGQFLSGKVKRRGLSWAKPVQFEAIDFYDNDFIYIATEKTVMRRQGLRRIRRR